MERASGHERNDETDMKYDRTDEDADLQTHREQQTSLFLKTAAPKIATAAGLQHTEKASRTENICLSAECLSSAW